MGSQATLSVFSAMAQVIFTNAKPTDASRRRSVDNWQSQLIIGEEKIGMSFSKSTNSCALKSRTVALEIILGANERIIFVTVLA